MRDLLTQIARVLPEGGDWCSLHKAQKLAALVVGLEPRVIVEIGVWLGGSLVPMALAQKRVGKGGIVIGIDPWSAAASQAGEEPANVAWWGGIDHDAAHAAFWGRITTLGLVDQVQIVRDRSDDVNPRLVLTESNGYADMIHVDGNHTNQAIRDVERFCPRIRIGGIAILDDVDWSGGNVAIAVQRARELGFVPLYPLDKGLVMQRTYVP